MSSLTIDCFIEYSNIFSNLHAEFKRLLMSDKFHNSITLNKEMWSMKEMIEWCIDITT